MPAWLWISILIPRAALTMIGFLHPERFIRPDSQDYLRLAQNIWRHGAFTQYLLETPEAFRLPGFPAFLGIWTTGLGLSLPWSITAQCVLGTAALWVAWTWLRSITTLRRANWAVFLLAMDPNLLFHTALILAEPLYLLLVTAAAALTWRYLDDFNFRRWAGIGFLWGATCLVRPVSIYLPLALSALFLRSKKVLGAFLVGSFLLPSLWCARNFKTFGTFAFTSQPGVDLMKYAAPAVLALQEHRSLEETQKSLTLPLDAAHAPYPSPFEKSRLYKRAALAFLARHPIGLLRYSTYGAARILLGSSFEMLFELTGIASDVPYPGYQPAVTGSSTLRLLAKHLWLIPFYAAYMIALLALYVFFVLGVYRLAADHRYRAAGFIAITAFYFLAISSLQGHYRFRLPMMPFLMAGAVAARLPRSGETASRKDQSPLRRIQ